MKQYKNKIIACVVIITVLAFLFWYGGDSPGLRGWTQQSEKTISANSDDKSQEQETTQKIADKKSGDEKPLTTAKEEKEPSQETTLDEIKQRNEEYCENQGMIIDDATGKDKYETDPVPEGQPIPVEPEDVVITDTEYTCILSVRCDTILNNIEWLDSEKVDIIPEDGVIFAEKTVTFYEGESVFDLLLREMKQNKIHMEFEHTPIYNSAYIEGIANLYEFDCGELSGWMYKVNGWFPNYGCSRYQLKSGDKVEWVYTCDLGVDVGGNYSTRNDG